MIKKFDRLDLGLMQELVGKKFTDIFKQLEMFIINFGEGIEYSLHTYTFCRVKSCDNVILTSNDEYFSPKYKYLSEKAYEKDELHKKSLLKYSILNVKEMLRNALVKKVEVSNIGDILIGFDNGIIFETLIDRKSQKFEYYRFIKFIPSYDEAHEKNSKSKWPHIVVSFVDGETVSETLEEKINKEPLIN